MTTLVNSEPQLFRTQFHSIQKLLFSQGQRSEHTADCSMFQACFWLHAPLGMFIIFHRIKQRNDELLYELGRHQGLIKKGQRPNCNKEWCKNKESYLGTPHHCERKNNAIWKVSNSSCRLHFTWSHLKFLDRKPVPYFLLSSFSCYFCGHFFYVFIFVLFIPCLHFEALESVLGRKRGN